MSLIAHTWFVCPDPMVCALLIRRLTKKNKKLSCYFVEHITTAFASGSLGFASQKPWCLKQLLLLLLWIERCCIVQLVGAIIHRILCIQLHRRASLWQRATPPPATCGRTVGQIIFSGVCVFVFIDVTDISCLSIEACSHFRAPALQRNGHNPDWITHCTPNSSGPNVKKMILK